jgi:hypothetical protein
LLALRAGVFGSGFLARAAGWCGHSRAGHRITAPQTARPLISRPLAVPGHSATSRLVRAVAGRIPDKVIAAVFA